MNLSIITNNLPFVALAIGVLLLVWGQRKKISSWIPKLNLMSKSSSKMSPSERFETFYALRSWCYEDGHTEAVEALDCNVLPVIVWSNGEE